MRKKLISGILLIVTLFTITGCGKANYTIGGKTLSFDKTYKDYYFTYKYPSEFKEKEMEQEDITVDKRHVYEYYDNEELSFILKVEEYSLGFSFTPMEEDIKELESDSEHKDVERTTEKVNRKNLVKYSFRKSDEFGENTLYHVYYGGYSYAGIYEYVKIYFINVEGKEDFEKAFISSFRINK